MIFTAGCSTFLEQALVLCVRITKLSRSRESVPVNCEIHLYIAMYFYEITALLMVDVRVYTIALLTYF